jgi:hypothetical protein
VIAIHQDHSGAQSYVLTFFPAKVGSLKFSTECQKVWLFGSSSADPDRTPGFRIRSGCHARKEWRRRRWRARSLDLSLSELKSEDTDGVIRREMVSGKCARQPGQPAVPAHPYTVTNMSGRSCNSAYTKGICEQVRPRPRADWDHRLVASEIGAANDGEGLADNGSGWPHLEPQPEARCASRSGMARAYSHRHGNGRWVRVCRDELSVPDHESQ